MIGRVDFILHFCMLHAAFITKQRALFSISFQVLTKPLKMETLRTVMHNKKLFASPMARAIEA